MRYLLLGFVLFAACDQRILLPSGKDAAFVEHLDLRTFETYSFTAEVSVRRGVVKSIEMVNGDSIVGFDFWETPDESHQILYGKQDEVFAIHLVEKVW